jgi:hypothetical protein
VSRRAAGWLAAAGVCAVASLGLPWSPGAGAPVGQQLGAGSPLRVFVVLAAVLVVAGLRTGRHRLLSLAVAAGLAGVLVGGPAATPSRVALAVAAGCLVAALRADGRPVLPRRRRGAPEPVS